MHRHALLSLLAIIVVALLAFAETTRGFTTITRDGARRHDLRVQRRVMPSLPLRFDDGAVRTLDAVTGRGRITLVSLVYTRCDTVCRVSASGDAWLQGEILRRGLRDDVRLLTLSFDPAHDTPATLAAHARRLRADETLWSFATVADRGDLRRLLSLFDVTVIDDGMGGYEHDGALFVVDEGGRLVDAIQIDRPQLALDRLLAMQGAR